MIFNYNDFTDLLVVEYIERSLLPPITNQVYNVPGRAGAQLASSDIGVGKIIVKCRIIGTTRIDVQETIREIAGLLYSEVPKRLELRDEPDKYNMAIVTGTTDLDKVLHTGYVEIEFALLDPYAYSINETTEALNSIFENSGTADSYATIEVSNYTGESLEISSGYNTLKLLFPFDGTEIIEFDLEKQRIFMNGNSAMKYLSFESDFFVIHPGENEIVSDAPGTIKYRSRWI